MALTILVRCSDCNNLLVAKLIKCADEGSVILVERCERCSKESFDDGYAEGEEAGYDEGYEEGSVKGQEEGYEEGYADGVAQGHDEGYNEGYALGFDEGSCNGC